MSTPNASLRGAQPGTPPKKQSRKAVKVYLTKEEKQHVKESAARTGQTLSGYGRRRLLHRDHPLFKAVLKTDLRMLACTLKEIETALSSGNVKENHTSNPTSEQPNSGEVVSQVGVVLRSIEKQIQTIEETFGR
ncbi:hypothetical protein BSZ35_18945 [Salinibacter sp. 10B]|uniref:plasmid mobilization protein n=1 Tax=Salinibacter sp. 10B TaxID=1923971 RepID=UPI000CF3C76F|nr:hypothetical protein [Salinibacter sp. 10B]PQJ26993.1 hypothetical protein BSZ35_18945 [Salinibacter sp. 10B]